MDVPFKSAMSWKLELLPVITALNFTLVYIRGGLEKV